MLARNRNILSFGLVAALVSGFSSCTEVPVDTQQLVKHQVHDEYVANFVAKYGQPSPNQSWDFTKNNLPEVPEAITRAESSKAVVTDTQVDPATGDLISSLASVTTIDEFEEIMAAEPRLQELPWDENEIYDLHDMYPWWVRYNEAYEQYRDTWSGGIIYTLGYAYFKDGEPVISYGPFNGQVTQMNEMYELYVPDYPNNVQYYNGEKYYSQYLNWYGAGIRLDASQYNVENVKDFFWFTNFNQASSTWYIQTEELEATCPVCGYVYTPEDAELAYCPNCWENYNQTFTQRKAIKIINEDWKAANGLTAYKEYVTRLGAKYRYFDVDHDGDYKDLVFLIEPVTMKRYIIEDLGALDDFDFNDIVVDVTDYYDAEKGRSQKALVRALGGTLDFTITIGSTTWTKSEHCEAFTPYNADGGSYTDTKLADLDKLYEFDVTGWDPDANNISVTVKKRDKTQNEGVSVTIPFPKEGEVPMMIAVDPTFSFLDAETQTNYFWMPERVSIPASYFTEVETTEP